MRALHKLNDFFTGEIKIIAGHGTFRSQNQNSGIANNHVDVNQHWFRNLLLIAGVVVAPEAIPELLGIAPEIEAVTEEIAAISGEVKTAVQSAKETVAVMSKDIVQKIESRTGVDATRVVKRLKQVYQAVGSYDLAKDVIGKAYQKFREKIPHSQDITPQVPAEVRSSHGKRSRDRDDNDTSESGESGRTYKKNRPESGGSNTTTDQTGSNTTTDQTPHQEVQPMISAYPAGFGTPYQHVVLTPRGVLGAHYDGGTQYEGIHAFTQPAYL
jgi:hypothetical protein